MMNKLLLFLALLSFSNLFSQQPYGIQRGQRGYIPPPKFESSVYITTIDSYEELNKTLPRCVGLFSLDDFEKEILKFVDVLELWVKKELNFGAKLNTLIDDAARRGDFGSLKQAISLADSLGLL